MSLESFLQYAGYLSTLAAAFGVIWGVYEYLQKTREEREERRAAGIEQWREAGAHQEFERAGSNGLTFEEFTRQMKSSGFGKQGDRVLNSELSDEALRLVLVSLIEKGIIELASFRALDGSSTPRYRVKTAPFAQEQLANNTEALPYVYEIVRDKSGAVDDGDICRELKEFNIPLPQMRTILLQLAQSGLVYQSGDGRWHLETQRAVAGRIAGVDAIDEIVKLRSEFDLLVQRLAQHGASAQVLSNRTN